MKKISKKARFVLVRCAFKGGGIVSWHCSLESALSYAKRYSAHSAVVLASIVALNYESLLEIDIYLNKHFYNDCCYFESCLYEKLPYFDTGLHYLTTCRNN